MKRSLFGACVLLTAAPLFAQTAATGAQPPTTPPGAAPQSVTMTGCVAGEGSDAQPFVLNNPLVVPSSGATAPGAVGSTPAAGAQPPTATPPSTVGTSGAGAAGTASTAAAAGSASASPGAVASGGTAAAISGYRLSGSDMKPWTGQRVEIVGSVVTRNASVASGAGVSPAKPELRVQSVRAVGGPCPQE